MLKLTKLFIAAVAMAVTFAANAQVTDQTRAQGYFDFYTAVLADTALPVTYYADADILLQNRDIASFGVPFTLDFFPNVYRVPNATTSTTAPAAGRTRLIEYVVNPSVVDLLISNLDGKVTSAELATTRTVLESGYPVSGSRYGFTVPDIETRRANALNAGAVDPNPAPTVTPTASGGGSSGSGAIAAVVIAGGGYYFWKKKNPTSTFNFAAMPTDTDAYVAEFNATPKENVHFNVRYTEGNLFADSDIIKPETNSTVMATVKWTW